MKKQDKNFKKTWMFLLIITATLFLVVGGVMVTIDRDIRLFQGIFYLATSIMLYVGMYKVNKGSIRDPTAFGAGFVFMVIGVSLSEPEFGPSIALWALGWMSFLKSWKWKK